MMQLQVSVLLLIILVQIQSGFSNNPELIQQLWKQLYSHLPDPSLPNNQQTGQRASIRLAVNIESVEFGHAYDSFVCRATLRLLASWSVVDARIAENTLVQMAGGNVLLDSDRVWHPSLTVPGARRLDRIFRRLELQSYAKPQRLRLQPSAQSITGGGDKNYPSDDPLVVSSDLNSGKQSGQGRRRENQAPVYVMSESINVEVLCSTPNVKHYLGSIHCPIVLKHGGRGSLATINLCFNPTGLVLRAAIPGLVLVLLSFILLWSLSYGLRLVSVAQGILLLLTLMAWMSTTSINSFAATSATGGSDAVTSIGNASRFSLIDAWFIVCFAFLLLTFLVTLLEHRRLERILCRRRMQQQRRVYAALNTSTPRMHSLTGCGGGGGGGGGSGGSNCGGACCGCTGYCGAASANGFLLQGVLNGQANPLGGGSPPPPLGMLHQPSPGGLPSKLDICNEAYLRSASCELSKESSAVMSMGTALRLRCARNGGLNVFDTNDSNLGLVKSQYAAATTGSPPASSLLQPLNPVPPSYCTTVVAVALPIIFLLTTIIFWGSLGAQGTVPKECLVSSITCQRLVEF